jgi:crotonobetaine/carnitine-CoA ligase
MPQPSVQEILEEVGCPTGTSYADLLRSMHAVAPETPAVEFEDVVVTYGELLSQIAGAANYLENELGLGQGDHVAIRITSCPLAVVTYLAIELIGAVLVPVYHQIEGKVLVGTLDRLDVDAIVVNPDQVDEVEALKSGLPRLKHVIPIEGSEFEVAALDGASIDPFLERNYPVPTDPAVILSTSGTTGLPKGVVLLNTYSGSGLIAARKWGMDEPVKAYLAASWGHGQIQFCINFAFWLGGSVVLTTRFSVTRYWDEIRSYGCNVIFPIGTMQQMLFNQPERPDDAENPAKYCFSVGMPSSIWEKFEKRFGVRVFEFYSGTDAGGCFISNHGIYPPGSIGRPWEEFEARIVDEHGNEVERGATGLLLMRTKGVIPTINYYGPSPADEEKVRDGWIWLGDLFRQDEEGNYYFVDRARDIIRRRGINLAPALIEAELLKFDGVREVAAFAVPSDLGEDEIKVVIVADPQQGLVEKAVEKFADANLPKHMRPRYIELADEIPKTLGTEKVQRYRLRETWRSSSTFDVTIGTYLSVDD